MTIDPNSVPPREPLPTLEQAAALLTDPRVLVELAYHSRDLRTRDELAARLEQAAVVHDRASDGFAARERYDLASGERESAGRLRRWGRRRRTRGRVHSRCTAARARVHFDARTAADENATPHARGHGVVRSKYHPRPGAPRSCERLPAIRLVAPVPA